jgi:hypothetical protein
MEEGQKTECSGNAILISRHYSRSFAPPSGPRPITRYDGATAASQRAVQQLPHKELCNRHSAARAASTRCQSADVNEQGIMRCNIDTRQRPTHARCMPRRILPFLSTAAGAR